MSSRILIFTTIIILSNLIICSLWAPTPAAYGMNESAYPAVGTSPDTQDSATRKRRGATIALYKEVTIRDSVVTIETIADIQSEDKAFGERLSKIEIERAPVVGYTRIFTVDDIKLCLQQHKIDLSQITFVGYERVAVSTKAIEITPEQLLNFARNYIQENFLADNDRNSIELAAMPVKLTIPDGEVSFRIPRGQETKIRLSQYTSIPIQIILNGKIYRTLILSLKVKSFKKVVVAAKAIPKDKHFGETDICMEERDIIPSLSSRTGPIPGSVFVKKSDVYGKRAKRRISRGEILTSGMIETPPLIYRGDKVIILVKSPHLKVTTLGMAREDGYEGKIIRVENISSKKIITAKVINEKLVRVEP
ncbi:MAG: flagellar basal body P-ring formation chaperone FlgA [Candidatus Poribacteria bacterium]